MRRAYTIVELLMVISILSILITIVFTSVTGSMQSARSAHAEALCRATQSAIEAYRASHDEWPQTIESHVNDRTQPVVFDGATESGAQQVKAIVKELVDEAKAGRPPMDISGLYVSRSAGIRGSHVYGLDFVSAVRGTSRSHTKMTTGEMYFGYPDPESGYFRSFRIKYNAPTDSVTVGMQQ